MEFLQLLWRLDHALGTLSRQMLGRLGVTSPQRLALRALLRTPGTTAAGLAQVLSVDRSSVAGILQRLQDAGLIERTPSDSDGRKQRIRVTDEGRRLDALRHGTVEAALERTLGAMGHPEIETVSRFLHSFTTELERERYAIRQSVT